MILYYIYTIHYIISIQLTILPFGFTASAPGVLDRRVVRARGCGWLRLRGPERGAKDRGWLGSWLPRLEDVGIYGQIVNVYKCL